MDNGYFSRQAKDIRIIERIALSISALISLLFALYSYLCYKHYGVDNALTPPIVFYPPKEFNPMDVGYVYDRNRDKEKAITAMLFYWADRGYLKIEETKRDNFTFIKLKDLPNDEGKAERMLFSLLFKSGDTVTIKNLEKNNFYENALKVFPYVKAQFNGEQNLYDKTASKKKKTNSVLLFISAAMIASISSLSAFGTLTLVLLAINIVSTSLIYAFSANLISKHYLRSRFKNILSFLPILFVSFVFFLMQFAINITIDITLLSLIQPIIIAIAYVVSSIEISATEKRSKYGENILEECLGYKDFIERVEIDKLKLLINDNPELFYNTLSYAIVFGLEEVWARKFKDLYIPKCQWYYSYNDPILDAMFFSSLSRRYRVQYSKLNSQRFNSNMPSGRGGSSSFSGFSGFSGGGFSGGGGRSW